MSEVLQAIASAFGKDTVSNDQHDDKTPAEKIKEKAIEEERTEVADGSNETTTNTTANGISTNPEEAHASDIKDKMSSKTDSTNNTINGADDNASMLPLGKGSYSEPAMDTASSNAAYTSNATPAGDNKYISTGTSAPMGHSLSSTSVTRAEITSAKEAIIRAVANCKLTREVVFSDTDTGTEDGSSEVKRVLSGYVGIDEALLEMNRYIPVHVRDSHDLGVKEGERIQKEQHEAAKALEPTAFKSAGALDPNEKISEEQALSETPAGTSGNGISTIDGSLSDIQKEELNRIPDSNDADATTTANTDSKDALEGVALQDMEPEAEHGITLGAGVIPGLASSTSETQATGAAAPVAIPISGKHDEEVNPTTTSQDREIPQDNDSKAVAIPVTEDTSSKSDEHVTASEHVSPSTESKDEAAILASTDVAPIDKGKGRVEGEGEGNNTEAAIATPTKSPIQGEKLSERLKREVEERARRGQLGVFNKPLGSNASQANLSSVAKEPDTTTASAATTSKDAPASSAFTEEFGAGETGLSPSSPTTTSGVVATGTKPPSARARTASLSSQTSTGEKRGLLGLFRRRSKRQSISDGSTGNRRASQDLSRSVSKDTVSSPVTASAVPPAPEKPVETIDTTTPAKEEDDTSKIVGIAAVGAGAGTATAPSAIEPEGVKDDTVPLDKSTTTAEPSTSEHKVEDVAPAAEKSTQTTHEPAHALGTAAEPVVYAEETAPITSGDKSIGEGISGGAGDNTGANAVTSAHNVEKEEPLHIEKHDSEDMIGPGAIAAALGEKATADSEKTHHESSPFKNDTAVTPATTAADVSATPATADKSTSTTAEKSTSTEDEKPALAPAVIAAPPAAPVHTTDDDIPLYSKDKTTSPGLERKSSKGGFFGLFRRRSSRRSSSGPPQRSVSEISNPTAIETSSTPTTENHVTPVIAAEKAEPKHGNESAVLDETPAEHETSIIHATDPEDPNSDAAKAELVRSDTDKEIAHEAEAYSEATIHAYGALNVDELETVEEEMERGPEETVAEPGHGSFIDHEEDEERETVQSDDEHDGVVATTGEHIPHEGDDAVHTTEETVPASSVEHDVTSDRITTPVVAATPAERLLQSGTERRKSRGSGFFSLFRSRTTRKDKDAPPQYNEYSTIVQNMGVVPKSETKGMAVAVGTDDLERSRSRTTARESVAHHGSAYHEHEEEHEVEEEEIYVEAEEEIPDNRSITEIAASIPLPAPVYTDKTRAKHERLRKKREHEEAIERERIRKENEILNKRERIMNAYTGKQDFTKVPKPARTKNFGRAHERKDLDGVQFVKKSDKKAAKKDDVLAKTTSRGSSINEPSSPSHPASGGFAGSFPVANSTSRVSNHTHATSGPDTEPGSPSSPVMVSPVIKLARRVSAITNKREKSVEPVPA